MTISAAKLQQYRAIVRNSDTNETRQARKLIAAKCFFNYHDIGPDCAKPYGPGRLGYLALTLMCYECAAKLKDKDEGLESEI